MSKESNSQYKKTQSSSSPGALGEEVNRKKNEVNKSDKTIIKTAALTEGLNEEKSAGNAGAFEGFENAGDKIDS